MRQLHRRVLASLLVLFFVQPAAAQFKDQQYSAGQVASDLDYLYQSLQDTHYNLFAFRSREEYSAAFAAIKEKVKGDSVSALLAISLFQSLASYANTGHCEVDFPVQSYIQYAYAGGTVFPMELAFEDGKVYVRNLSVEITGVAKGDEIIRIDGEPVLSVTRAFEPYVSAEREYAKNARFEFWSFPRLYFQAFGEKKEWQVEIRQNAGPVSTITVKSVPVIEYETKRGGEVVSPKRAFQHYGETAYLNPGGFGSESANGEEIYKHYIDSVFTVIQKQESKNLVIDLRNNPGGHNAYSDYLIGYFASRPFHWYSAFSLKTSRILKEQVRSQKDTTDAYSRAILTHADGSIFRYDFPAHSPVEESKKYKGNVYVLVNRQTYSMAAVAAALVQDYRFGKIVGEETGDTPTLYASQFSYPLPNTGVIVKVPKGYIVRPGGNEDVVGVKPDMVIRDHLIDDKDEILEGLLKMINKE